MEYQFYTVDVFTEQIFGGNQLAVFPQGEGLTEIQMQKIAAEFNFSETAFILPPETNSGDRRVRIFTPTTELPFAGHPTIGTAYILGAIGAIALPQDETRIILEEGVGLVPVTILSQTGKPFYTELTSPQLPQFRDDVPTIADLAQMLSLESKDLEIPNYSPQAVSCGLPFLFIPLSNRRSLAQAQLQPQIWETLLKNSWAQAVYLFCFEPEREGSDVRVRMFAPHLGVREDPATGSAAAAFGGYLGRLSPLGDGTLRWVIEQGFEMGRPSILRVETDKVAGQIRAIRVGGASVLVTQGVFRIS